MYSMGIDKVLDAQVPEPSDVWCDTHFDFLGALGTVLFRQELPVSVQSKWESYGPPTSFLWFPNREEFV